MVQSDSYCLTPTRPGAIAFSTGQDQFLTDGSFSGPRSAAVAQKIFDETKAGF